MHFIPSTGLSDCRYARHRSTKDSLRLIISFPYLLKFPRFPVRTFRKNCRFSTSLLPSHERSYIGSIFSRKRREFVLSSVPVSRLSGFPLSGSSRLDQASFSVTTTKQEICLSLSGLPMDSFQFFTAYSLVLYPSLSLTSTY